MLICVKQRLVGKMALQTSTWRSQSWHRAAYRTETMLSMLLMLRHIAEYFEVLTGFILLVRYSSIERMHRSRNVSEVTTGLMNPSKMDKDEAKTIVVAISKWTRSYFVASN